MPYLLDSKVVIYHLAGIEEAVALVSRLASEDIAISVVSYMEVYQSIFRVANPASAAAILSAFLEPIQVLPFSEATARRCARLREDLAAQNKRVRQRALDLLIAATALEHDLTLVTRNREDFEDIPQLRTHFYASA